MNELTSNDLREIENFKQFLADEKRMTRAELASKWQTYLALSTPEVQAFWREEIKLHLT